MGWESSLSLSFPSTPHFPDNPIPAFIQCLISKHDQEPEKWIKGWVRGRATGMPDANTKITHQPIGYDPRGVIRASQISHDHLLARVPAPPQCLLLPTMGLCTFAKALIIMANLKNNARAASHVQVGNCNCREVILDSPMQRYQPETQKLFALIQNLYY